MLKAAKMYTIARIEEMKLYNIYSSESDMLHCPTISVAKVNVKWVKQNSHNDFT